VRQLPPLFAALTLIMIVRLACGHVAAVPASPYLRVGGWVSCWALMYPSEDSCQTQRKVVGITPGDEEEMT
jgi:hypothetical protein